MKLNAAIQLIETAGIGKMVNEFSVVLWKSDCLNTLTDALLLNVLFVN